MPHDSGSASAARNNNMNVFVRVRPNLDADPDNGPTVVLTSGASTVTVVAPPPELLAAAPSGPSVAPPTTPRRGAAAAEPVTPRTPRGRTPGGAAALAAAVAATPTVSAVMASAVTPYTPGGKPAMPPAPRSWSFDRVFDVDASQEDVFGAVKPLVLQALDGINATVFAYGQTGAGKTYTMMGEDERVGVIPRTIAALFAEMDQRMRANPQLVYHVKVTFVELYNDRFRDLLSSDNDPDMQRFKLPDHVADRIVMKERNKSVFLEGTDSLYTPITSVDEALLLVKKGSRARHVASTDLNSRSSRSHAILTFNVECGGKPSGITTSRLHLVDLAGSERVEWSHSEGERLKEAQHINDSLSTLADVFAALCKPQPSGNVPYRNSKLTRLLQDSIGGNASTIMICNVVATGRSYRETVNSLMWAARARHIKQHAVRILECLLTHVNVDVAGESKLRKLQLEIEELSKKLEQRNAEFASLEQISSQNHASSRDLADKLQVLARVNHRERALLDERLGLLIFERSNSLAAQQHDFADLQQRLVDRQTELLGMRLTTIEQEDEITELKFKLRQADIRAEFAVQERDELRQRCAAMGEHIAQLRAHVIEWQRKHGELAQHLSDTAAQLNDEAAQHRAVALQHEQDGKMLSEAMETIQALDARVKAQEMQLADENSSAVRVLREHDSAHEQHAVRLAAEVAAERARADAAEALVASMRAQHASDASAHATAMRDALALKDAEQSATLARLAVQHAGELADAEAKRLTAALGAAMAAGPSAEPSAAVEASGVVPPASVPSPTPATGRESVSLVRGRRAARARGGSAQPVPSGDASAQSPPKRKHGHGAAKASGKSAPQPASDDANEAPAPEPATNDQPAVHVGRRAAATAARAAAKRALVDEVHSDDDEDNSDDAGREVSPPLRTRVVAPAPRDSSPARERSSSPLIGGRGATSSPVETAASRGATAKSGVARVSRGSKRERMPLQPAPMSSNGDGNDADDDVISHMVAAAARPAVPKLGLPPRAPAGADSAAANQQPSKAPRTVQASVLSIRSDSPAKPSLTDALELAESLLAQHGAGSLMAAGPSDSALPSARSVASNGRRKLFCVTKTLPLSPQGGATASIFDAFTVPKLKSKGGAEGAGTLRKVR